jgi:AraC-like DNA-binding protein
MHNYAHGKIPNVILEVDEDIVESFLGRIEDPEKSSYTDINIINDPAQRTIMAIRYLTSSLNGLSYYKLEANSQQTIGIVGDKLKQFGGRLVDHDEGYLLISFKSAYKSVLCAFELESLFKDHIAELYNSNIHIKIGLASGMPVEENKTFFEDTIKLANRLCFIDKSNIVLTPEVQSQFIAENLSTPYDKGRIYSLPSLEEKYLNILINFIEKKWNNPLLRVEDFGLPLAMSKTQAYRKIVFLTGKSPNTFLKEYRLNRALERINKNTNTFSEIAYETGFNSQSYFSKCFHRRFHVLPSDYIKS